MGALLQYVSASALSVTLGGNSGVAPFMTLLIVGIIERIDPSILNMEDWVQKVVSSWPSIVVLGALTIVELVAKFVPCVDVVYESSMAFVAPILSIFGSVSAFGLFNVDTQEQSRTLYYAGQHNMTDYGYRYEPNNYYYEDHVVAGEEFNNHRRLAEKSGWLVFLQVMLCLVGIIISILVHLFKLLMRLIGQGCCTCCITTAEYTWTVTSVIITILIVPIAIATAIILILAAGVGFKKKVWDERIKKKHEAAAAAATKTTTITAEVETDGKKKIANETKSDGPVDIDEEVGTKTKNVNE